MNMSILNVLNDIVKIAENNIKTKISKHPLYVMFEPKLDCNPKTDHLYPKNVLPLFDADISMELLKLKNVT